MGNRCGAPDTPDKKPMVAQQVVSQPVVAQPVVAAAIPWDKPGAVWSKNGPHLYLGNKKADLEYPDSPYNKEVTLRQLINHKENQDIIVQELLGEELCAGVLPECDPGVFVSPSGRALGKSLAGVLLHDAGCQFTTTFGNEVTSLDKSLNPPTTLFQQGIQDGTMINIESMPTTAAMDVWCHQLSSSTSEYCPSWVSQS